MDGEGPKTQLIIDTDMDYDDVMGLLFAARSPNVELLLVTVCNTGFGWPIWATDLARAVLQRVGAGTVPVANGTSTPFAAAATFPEAWGVQTINYLGPPFGVSSSSGSTVPDALASLIAALEATDGLVDYVALGAQTNLAEAMLDPVARELMRQKLRRVVISGGAFKIPGNVASSALHLLQDFEDQGGSSTKEAECNVFLDARAAEIVCREAQHLGIEVIFMPLDATDALVVAHPQTQGNAEAPPTLPLELLQGTLRGFQATMPPDVQPRYWDAAAVVFAVQEAICGSKFSVQGLRVETRIGQGYPYGHLIWERMDQSVAARANTTACMHGSYATFLSEFWAPFGVQHYS